MIVMPDNNSNAHKMEAKYPGRMGLLIGPGGWRDPRGLPFALDNGRFVCWSKGSEWPEAAFWRLLECAQACDTSPRWVVVPDVVADADATFRQWDQWAPRLEETGLTLAMAVQDGMTPESVKRNAEPGVIFVGGSTQWKRNTMWKWCRSFPRVHIGRVNTEKRLWNAHRCGAESVDGTGFFRGCVAQLKGLHRYLRRSSAGMGPPQLELEFAATFARHPDRMIEDVLRNRRTATSIPQPV